MSVREQINQKSIDIIRERILRILPISKPLSEYAAQKIWEELKEELGLTLIESRDISSFPGGLPEMVVANDTLYFKEGLELYEAKKFLDQIPNTYKWESKTWRDGEL